MELRRIEATLAWSDYLVIRMMRRWAASCQSHHNPLPAIVSLGTELGLKPELAISLHSVFQLSESLLGRALVPECCCSSQLSTDEEAVLLLLAAVSGSAGPRLVPAIPHGLPGALCWAVIQARLALGARESEPNVARVAQCPFLRPQ